MKKRVSDLKYQEMYNLYLDGLSLQQVGKAYGVTRQSVYDGFKTRGFKLRNKKLLPFVIIDGLKFTKTNYGYWYCTTKESYSLHRHVWEKENGPLPEGYEIHHKDFDKSNNELSNLQALTTSDHAKLHSDLLNGAANNQPIIRKSDGKIWPSMAQLSRDLGTESVKVNIRECRPYKGEVYERV